MKRVLFTDAHLEKLKSLVLGLNENQSLTIIHSYQLPLKREGNYDEKNFRQTKINALLTLFRGFFDRRKEFTNLIEAAESKEREKSLEELIKKAQEDFWPCDYNIPFLFKKIDDINISTRMKNIVRSANIKTLLELAQISEERFKEFRTCGDAIVREAKEVLGSHGLMFGMKFDPELVALVHQSLK